MIKELIKQRNIHYQIFIVSVVIIDDSADDDGWISAAELTDKVCTNEKHIGVTFNKMSDDMKSKVIDNFHKFTQQSIALGLFKHKLNHDMFSTPYIKLTKRGRKVFLIDSEGRDHYGPASSDLTFKQKVKWLILMGKIYLFATKHALLKSISPLMTIIKISAASMAILNAMKFWGIAWPWLYGDVFSGVTAFFILLLAVFGFTKNE